MALFGNKKTSRQSSRQEEKKKVARVYHANSRKLSDGVAHEIIRAPWFSEKSLIIIEKGVYTFEVPKSATKAEIAGAIKEIYNVEPRAVRIVNLPPKRKAMRTKRGFGTRAARHKAYVYLNHGDTISFT